MRYIGFDLGTKTLGVSVSDNLGLIASAYKTIRFNENDYESLLKEVENVLKEFNTNIIVLGLPKNMNNTLGDAANRSLNFKKLLEDNFDVKVIMQDERLSSVEANNIMISGGVTRKKRNKSVDSLAANIILQSYLDKRKEDNNE